MYRLYTSDGSPSLSLIRSTFRANTSSLTAGTGTNWPYAQYDGQGVLDADGDLTISFAGYGPDTSESIFMAPSWFADEINATTNSDLLLYFNPAMLPYGLFNNGDVDGAIDEVLWMAQAAGANDEQMGRLNRILQQVSAPLRGEGNGALFSMFDADTQNNLHLLYSDNVANTLRDGRNDRWFIALDERADSGDVTVRLTNMGPYGLLNQYVDFDLGVVYDGNFDPERIDVEATRQSIEASIQSLALTGDYWPLTTYLGSVEVRTVYSDMANPIWKGSNAVNTAEWNSRLGTDWDLENIYGGLTNNWVVYEVTFLGEVHDSLFSLELAPAGHDMEWDSNPCNAPLFNVAVGAEVGIEQTETTIGMEPDGDFTMAWEQWEESTNHLLSNNNFYFRTFDESSDTAGPTVSDTAFADGSWIRSGVQVTNDTLLYNETDGARIVLTFDEQMKVFSEEEMEWARGIRSQYQINPNSVTQDNVTKARTILDSVTNPENYELLRNDRTFAGGVAQVEYGLNKAYELGLSDVRTNKWEAVLHLDGDMVDPTDGYQPLAHGAYQLNIINPIPNGNLSISQSGLRDKNGQPLYGTGYVPTGSVYEVNEFLISSSDGAAAGEEFRVSGPVDIDGDGSVDYEDAGLVELFAEENDYGLTDSVRSVAVDHDGDFVVVWTTQELDGDSGGVYFRLFDRNNVPLTDVLQANTTVRGDQCNAVVAMDADGEFVIVWESVEIVEDQFGNPIPNDNGYHDIYMRRYDATGRPMTDAEELVNRDTTEQVNDQHSPAVAMDNKGNFVVVWATSGQDFSYFNDIHGKIYNNRGQAVVDEFRMNTVNWPGTVSGQQGSYEVHPTVALSEQGVFMVTWNQVVDQDDGLTVDVGIVGRLFDLTGTPLQNGVNNTTNEFQVNVSDPDFTSDDEVREHWVPDHLSALEGVQPTAYRQTARNAQITVDDAGNFYVVWESYQDNDIDDDPPYIGDLDFEIPDIVDSYGIYARKFAVDGTPSSDFDYNVNLVRTVYPLDPHFSGDQMNPSVAVDSDGDLWFVWDGQGAEPDADFSGSYVLDSDYDESAVWIRQFHAGLDSAAILPTRVSVQTRVNRTELSDQETPCIAVEPDGDRIVVWAGNGVDDFHGIFARRYDEATDNAGPLATEIRFITPTGVMGDLIDEQAEPLQGEVHQLAVIFDEEMWTADEDSVENVQNWVLEREDGVVIQNAISSINYYFRSDWNKWVAELTFDTAIMPNGLNGSYHLIALAPVQDDPLTPANEARSGLRGRHRKSPFSERAGRGRGGRDPELHRSDEFGGSAFRRRAD